MGFHPGADRQPEKHGLAIGVPPGFYPIFFCFPGKGFAIGCGEIGPLNALE
jgi:hypothetical protein